MRILILALILTSCTSLPQSEVDYTEPSRLKHREAPAEWCQAMEDGRTRGEAKAYCEEAYTDSCLVYLEECL